jgi:hypothetical protein
MRRRSYLSYGNLLHHIHCGFSLMPRCVRPHWIRTTTWTHAAWVYLAHPLTVCRITVNTTPCDMCPDKSVSRPTLVLAWRELLYKHSYILLSQGDLPHAYAIPMHKTFLASGRLLRRVVALSYDTHGHFYVSLNSHVQCSARSRFLSSTALYNSLPVRYLNYAVHLIPQNLLAPVLY